MANLLYRLGRFSYQRRRLVAVLWALFLVVLGVGALTLGGKTANTFSIPGTESQRALDALKQELPAASGASATVVVKAPAGKTLTDPTVKAAVGATVLKVTKVPEVIGAVDPFTSKAISPDGTTGLISVQFDKPADELSHESSDGYDGLSGLSNGDLQVVPGGQIKAGVPEIGATEVIGVAVAAVVLVVTFGSLVAAGMTLVTALLGVLAGMAGLFIVTAFTDVSSTAPILALMLGLAVGIDYSLFISSRHRAQLGEGMDPEESVARATATAGSAVLFAGATVVIALAGLSVVGVPFLTAMGLAAAATVLTDRSTGRVDVAARTARLRRKPGAAAEAPQDLHRGRTQGGVRFPMGPAGDPAPRTDRCRRHHRARPARDSGEGHAARPAGRRLGGRRVEPARRVRPDRGRLRAGRERAARGGCEEQRRRHVELPGTAGPRQDADAAERRRGTTCGGKPGRYDEAAAGDPENGAGQLGHL